MFKWVFLMAFFKMFRMGELGCDSKRIAQRAAMTLNDVQIKKK
jgi:hypothetical protein